MIKYILILTQDLNNKSVEILKESLQKQAVHSPEKDYKVLVWDVNKIIVNNKYISLLSNSNRLNFQSPILISDLALVIKRTWGPIRTKALLICRALEQHGALILNGCEFIGWSHSKIRQYDTLKEWHIFPKTVCFDKQFILSMREKNVDDIVKTILQRISTQLNFPLVFKTDEGCRGDGVYLIESSEELKVLIKDILLESSKNKHSEFNNGFLLQEFIMTDAEKSISNYYRINLVNGRPQSAVQFQLKWEESNGRPYQKLFDFDGAEDKPVSLEIFDPRRLKKIALACPCQNGVVGVDVACNSGEIWVLEYNDGPMISQIVESAERYQKLQKYTEEVGNCANFPNAIANLCMNRIKFANRNTLVFAEEIPLFRSNL